MRIKITSDSTCDLSQKLVQQYDIGILPLVVVKGGQHFHDGVTITSNDIFQHVAAGGDLCTTAAVNIEEYIEFFTPFAKEYDAVIHVNLSSEFSSCHQNARLAAEEFDNVRVIDSRNLSTGQGHVVLEAARLAKELEDLDEICARLRELTTKVEASFILKKLNYLAKGGRCSSVTALGANLLNLRPCINVVDGKMSVGKKYRGSFDKCLAAYIQDRLVGREDIQKDLIFITHTKMEDGDMKSAMDALKKHGSDFRQIEETVAGCTISCHCGPETLGILFVRK